MKERPLVESTFTAEQRRGHGAMYDAVNHGWLQPRRLRSLLDSTLLRAGAGRGLARRRYDEVA